MSALLLFIEKGNSENILLFAGCRNRSNGAILKMVYYSNQVAL